MEMFDPPHPGLGIRAWMAEDVTVSALAKHLGMTRANLSMILNGRLGVSAAVALKLGEAFPKTDARFWLALQSQYDLAHARRKRRRKISPIRPREEALKIPVKQQTAPRLKKAA